jgi:hypothetical protein
MRPPRLHDAGRAARRGERDAMSPLANARLLAARIPDAELAIVPGAGHACALERPEESLALLVEWLERRAPIPAGAPRTGAAPHWEPFTRTLGLPIGALRSGASLAELASERIREVGRSGHVAAER